MKIMIAEDTKDLNRVLTVALEHAGYTVDHAFDGEEASELIAGNGYDAIILDIMMPKKDGITVLKELREQHISTPVLMLTAKSEVDDRVMGLDAGADDYLAKPFAMKELLARVRAMTRRKNEYGASIDSYRDLKLDAGKCELRCESAVRLSLKEYELLQILITHAGKPMTTEELLERVWSVGEEATVDTLWLYILYLRGKLKSVSSSVTIEGEKGESFRIS